MEEGDTSLPVVMEAGVTPATNGGSGDWQEVYGWCVGLGDSLAAVG